MKLVSYLNQEIDKYLLLEICKFKETYWSYSLRDQKKWLEKNVKKNDIHNILLDNKGKVIGYTLLRNKFFYKIDKNLNKKYYLDFILLDTVLLSKENRNFINSNVLMKFNHKIINKFKKSSILFCENKMIKFYKFYKWELIPQHVYKTNLDKKKMNCMILNKKYSSIKFNQNLIEIII